jgi:putative endonuclease
MREKVLKGWLRKKKIMLVEGMNPTWEDLSEGWFGKQVLRCAQDDNQDR